MVFNDCHGDIYLILKNQTHVANMDPKDAEAKKNARQLNLANRCLNLFSVLFRIS
jgi:hypothetical protein